MIPVTAAVEAATLDNQPPVLLVEIEFTSVTLYLTNAGRDIEWSGISWLANGFITADPENSQERELRTTSDSIGLTGVDQTVTAILLTESQVNRPVTIREAFIDKSTGQIIPDPYIRDVYFISQVSMTQDLDTAEVELTLAGEFADFEFRAGIRTTDASLQRIYPGDRLFRYATAVSKEQQWEGR